MRYHIRYWVIGCPTVKAFITNKHKPYSTDSCDTNKKNVRSYELIDALILLSVFRKGIYSTKYYSSKIEVYE